MKTTGENTVDIEPFARVFKARGETAWLIAIRLNWMRARTGKGSNTPDTSRVLRQLGLKPHNEHGESVYRKHCTYDRGVELAEALGVDPVDVGV